MFENRLIDQEVPDELLKRFWRKILLDKNVIIFYSKMYPLVWKQKIIY